VDELAGVTFFEVDHPATQKQKRHVMAQAYASSAAVRYLEWNFEREALSSLASRLAEIGHDSTQPTFTVWEGVTMYLTEAAIDATLAAVKAFSSTESRLVFTYMNRDYVQNNTWSARFVATVGEPWTFGWNPSALPAFLTERGFSLVADDDMAALAKRWLTPRLHGDGDSRGRHVAIAQIP
jgi:methyltransferase (TIGR00027 family)